MAIRFPTTEISTIQTQTTLQQLKTNLKKKYRAIKLYMGVIRRKQRI